MDPVPEQERCGPDPWGGGAVEMVDGGAVPRPGEEGLPAGRAF